MFKDTEYANIRGAYLYLGIEPLTRQQELMVLTYMRGTSMAAAARAAGVQPSTARKLLKEDSRIPILMEYFRAQMFTDAMVTMEMLNSMALEAHRKSGSATEELKAIETLAKLNQMGGYASQVVLKAREEASKEKDVTPQSTKELEQMSEDKLLQIAKLTDSLDPTPVKSSAAEEAMRIAQEFVECDDVILKDDDEIISDYEVVDGELVQ